VIPELRPEVRTALHAAANAKGEPVSGHAHAGADPNQRVEVTVTPVTLKGALGHFLVSFRRSVVAPSAVVAEASNGDSNDAVHLRTELRRVRDELESTIEELQSSNEEMKASSEEVMSINEELQSTNEELETSKEELQSMNEELRTLNAQLQNKMEEHEATSNDLTSLLSSTEIAVVFLDDNFRIRRYTPMVKDLFELIPGDVGRPITDLARKFADPDLTTDCQEVLAKLIPREREVVSASNRIYARRVLPYRTAENQIRGVVITFMDVTERKQIEDALRQSEERQRLFIEGAPDFAMLLIDLEGRIAAWNVGAERLLGYQEQEAVGQSAGIIFLPEQREEGPEREMSEAAAKGRAINETWHVRKDGTQFWGSGILAPVRDAEGKITGFVKVLRDESSRKRAEVERASLLQSEQAARQEAENATRLKDKFLATLSHELRTPLSSILMWAQMLLRKPMSGKDLEEALHVIARSAEAQKQLLDDLLDTSRIATGKITLNTSPVDLSALVKQLIDSIRPLCEEKKIRIETELPERLPLMMLDADRIRQVVGNLLTNAVKFTPEKGRVAISLTGRNDGVELSISDSGIGIDPQFLPHVFTAFSQGDNGVTRLFGGLGLGLAIAKQFVELHGGSIAARSPGRGQGSTFVVRLPTGQPLPAIGPPTTAGDATSDGSNIEGTAILLVEDDRASRDAIARFLGSEGARVNAVTSAAAARSAFQDSPPQVVISDIGLPDQSGYELMQQIRSYETEHKMPPTPAIALTAYASQEDSRKAREAGYQIHVPKPVNPTELLTILVQLLAT
jgi:two-component system CheB/CheR fusion protein